MSIFGDIEISRRLWIIYYSLLAVILIVGISYYVAPSIFNVANSTEHHIGVNVTKTNDTCRITWLGGWDFDSFYTNVTIDGVNVGHPKPMTEIYNGFCKNLTVFMYDKSVKTDMLLYEYVYNGRE